MSTHNDGSIETEMQMSKSLVELIEIIAEESQDGFKEMPACNSDFPALPILLRFGKHRFGS